MLGELKQIGRKFAIFSIIGILSLSIFTSIMHHVPTLLKVIHYLLL